MPACLRTRCIRSDRLHRWLRKIPGAGAAWPCAATARRRPHTGPERPADGRGPYRVVARATSSSLTSSRSCACGVMGRRDEHPVRRRAAEEVRTGVIHGRTGDEQSRDGDLRAEAPRQADQEADAEPAAGATTRAKGYYICSIWRRPPRFSGYAAVRYLFVLGAKLANNG